MTKNKKNTKYIRGKNKNLGKRVKPGNTEKKAFQNRINGRNGVISDNIRIKGSPGQEKTNFIKTVFNDYSDKKFAVIAASLIFILAFSLFLNNIHNKFTNWDDPALILHNQSIRSLDLDNIIKIFTPSGGTFQPVRVLSYAIDYRIDKFNPVVFHLHNNILHALAAVVLFLMLLKVIPYLLKPGYHVTAGAGASANANANAISVQRVRIVALMTALLFAVHPVNVEAVTWLSDRKYTLLALFFFLSVYLFVKSYETVSIRSEILYSVASYFCAGLAVLSSPFGVVIPVVLFMFDYCRDDNINPFKVLRKRIRHHLVYIILFAFLVPVLAKGLSGAGKQYYMDNPLYTVYTMMRCLFDYARNMLCPLWLNARYVDLMSLSPWEYKIIISGLVLVFILVYIIMSFRKKNRFPLFCFGWFFIIWAPVSDIIIPISTTMADRYIYVPGIGIYLLFAGVITGWMENCNHDSSSMGRNLYHKMFFLFFVSVVITCSVLTFQRNKVWGNSETLWLNCLQCSNLNKVAHNNLGQVYVEQGKYKLAVKHFKAVLQIDPDFTMSRYNLGNVYLIMGKNRKAAEVFQSLINSGHGDAKTYYNLGLSFLNLNQLDRAETNFKKCLLLKPEYPDALNNLGNAFFRQKYYSSAAANFSKAISIAPGFVSAYNNMGMVEKNTGNIKKAVLFFKKALYYRQNFHAARKNLVDVFILAGSYSEAIAESEKLLKFNSKDVNTHVNLGGIFTRTGRLKDAEKQYRTALKLAPTYGEVYYNLGTVLMLKGKIREAEENFKKSIKYNPSYYKSYYNLGNIKFNQKLFKEAAAYYRKALAMNPDYADCHSNLGSALLSMGDIKDALMEFKKALKLNPDNADAHYNIANIFFAMKNYKEGIKHYKKVLEIKPDFSANAEIRQKLLELDNNYKLKK